MIFLFLLHRYTMYADNSQGGQGVSEKYAWNFEGTVESKIWQGLSAGASVNYSLMNLVTGDAYSSDKSDSGFEKNSDGTEGSRW